MRGSAPCSAREPRLRADAALSTPGAGRLAEAASEAYGHWAASIINREPAPIDRPWAGLGSVSSTDQVRLRSPSRSEVARQHVDFGGEVRVNVAADQERDHVSAGELGDFGPVFSHRSLILVAQCECLFATARFEEDLLALSQGLLEHDRDHVVADRGPRLCRAPAGVFAQEPTSASDRANCRTPPQPPHMLPWAATSAVLARR